MTAEHIDYAALQAAMNPAKEDTMSTADEVPVLAWTLGALLLRSAVKGLG